MVKKIDARGFACPQPVVLTKKALEEMEAGTIEVVVDNKAASENVSRLAINSGCEVEVRACGNDFIVKVTKSEGSCPPELVSGSREQEIPYQLETPRTGKGTVIFIAGDTIGSGSDELGGILMKALFPTLLEVEPKPWRLIFMNSGVKLTTEGSEFLDSLANLERKGAELLVCGTCLDYFGLKEKVKAGRVSNFYEITETMLNADKVIRM